jgi:uracil phosphoribosyltransferase
MNLSSPVFLTSKPSRNSVVESMLANLRDKNTNVEDFRKIVDKLTMLLTQEALKKAELIEVEVETPVEKTLGFVIDETKYVAIGILRAGAAMWKGVQSILPDVEK